MTYETFANRNATEGLGVLFVYVNDVTNGMFINMFLFCLFLITFLGNFFSMKRLTGEADIGTSFAVAGFFLVGATLILSLIPDMINTFVLTISVVISIVGALWVWMGNSSN